MSNVNLRSKNLYKIFLIIIKYIPTILAVLKIIGLVCSYCKINLFILTCVGGTSFIMLCLLYTLSFLFQFCGTHRLSLNYVTCIHLITLVDYYIGIPLEVSSMFYMYAIITGIFITSWIYVWYTHRHNTRIDHIKRLCDSYC